MKESHAGRPPKRPGTEPPVRLRPTRPGIDAEDDVRTDAAKESIELMQAVEHPGEFPPAEPARSKRTDRKA
jgi:hypothetical protein